MSFQAMQTSSNTSQSCPVVEMSPMQSQGRNHLEPIGQSGVCLVRSMAFLIWVCWRDVNVIPLAIKHWIPLMSVDLTETESQGQWDETPHKAHWRWSKVLQEDSGIHSLSLEDIYLSIVAMRKSKYLQFCLCYMAQTNGANLALHVKNPEKHLVLFSRFACCDLEHGHHTDSLLVPKMETSTWEDPAFHAILVMMTFERQFA